MTSSTAGSRHRARAFTAQAVSGPAGDVDAGRSPSTTAPEAAASDAPKTTVGSTSPGQAAPTSGVFVLLGPTASGKSELALRLARWSTRRGRPAEIINADSMQVYRGMDIGTAKPTPAQQAEIPHHLIDGLELDQTASVADFQRLARQAIADCHRRGVRPIVVGGSALYLRAITDRFEFPPQDPVRRSELEAELAAVGPAVLYQRLERLDPQAAAGILPGNGRRIVRALEAIAVTGAFRSQLPPFEFALPRVRLVGLAWPRPQLDERIEQRVKAMWADGLLTEVAGLLERGLRQAPTAAKAIGYAQAIACLDGDLTPAEAQQAIVTKTRQFARKQLAWWRRDPRIVWCAAEPLLRHDVAGQGGPDFLTAD